MEPQGAPNENTTYNRYKADHTTSLIWHVLACLPTCPSLLRVPILATLAGIAVEATLGLDVKVVTLLSNGLHDALHSHALNTTELKPLWHMVWTSLGKLFDTVIHVTGDKSETFFTHIALCLYLGGPNSSVILNDRYIPLLLETPRIHWDTIFPSAINALLIQWYSRIIITSPDHIFALTEGIMRLVSHAAARSTPVLLASATTIMSFSIRTNNKPLATRLLQAVVPARRAHGRLDFDFLSTVLLPLTTMMCTGGWSLTEDSLAPFWKQTIEHFGPALDKLQRGSDWMVVAQSLTYGNFGCGRHECNASILDEASGSDI
ncbi:hypothetical protein SISSUDRAFT_481632 [Sistotremastrum suecicum HHB10207 ss-3]|uniref:Uncharacterized protein n=1 Tax=Sistotremastrum suecicum HHB10207 ss-3 TaxID=1314776 RepID=A0A166FBI2_9AGAM|nr:hypothetical protein SISSUDRAFT_481632 [Sistotremastrum suecicum HHB10207 ss-3]